MTEMAVEIVLVEALFKKAFSPKSPIDFTTPRAANGF